MGKSLKRNQYYDYTTKNNRDNFNTKNRKMYYHNSDDDSSLQKENLKAVKNRNWDTVEDILLNKKYNHKNMKNHVEDLLNF